MKHITSLLLISLVSLTVIASDGIRFEQNLTWAQIKAKAKKENKMIFFDAYASWCGPCKYLESTVYTVSSVASYYNTNYINVKFDMEKGEGIQLAAEFSINAYPTLLFFSPDGKLVHKTVGGMDAPEFITLGKDARNPEKQYFTLESKILDHTATTAAFLNWLKIAEEIDEPGRATAAAAWLSARQDLLASAELAGAAIQYADVNETQLAYLYKEKKKIQQLLKWDAEKTNASLYYKLFGLALKSYDDQTKSTTTFSNMIKKFEPNRVNYALKELQLYTALNPDADQEKASGFLVAGLKNTQADHLKETSMLLYSYAQALDENAITKLKTALAAYRFTAADKGQECWVYLMQVVCFMKLEEYGKAKLSADKAIKHGGLTQTFKDLLHEMF